MALLVLLGSGLFLASAVAFDHRLLQLVLLLIFLSTGLLVHYRLLTAYFAFIFLFPLLPSQWQDLSSFDFLEFFFVCLAFWWAADRIKRKQLQLPKHSLTPFISLFVLVSAISVLLALLRNHFVLSEIFFLKLKDNWNIFLSNPSSDLSPLRNLIYLLEGMLCFYITVDLLDTSERIRRTGKIIFYSSILVSLLGILQYAFRFHLLEFWVKENPEIVRINSTFSDPNSLGTYLATVFCFATFAYFPHVLKKNIFHFLLIAILFLALIFTASRAGLGAAFLILFLLPAVWKWFGVDATRYLRGPILWFAKYGPYVTVSVVALLIVAAGILNYRNPSPGSLFQVALFTFNPQLTLNEVLKGRITYWDRAWELFSNHPVFGCGAGNFVNVQLYAPYFETQPENAHNYFLQLLAETGIAGLLLFCVILFQGLRFVLRKLKSAEPGDFGLLFAFFSGWIAFLLTCMTGHPLLLLKLQFLFWIFLGILSANGNRSPVLRSKLVYIVLGCAILLLGAFQVRSIIHSRSIPIYEHGYHVWEKDDLGNLFRWTKSAAISKMEVHGEVLSFHLRQLDPESMKRPAFVKLLLNDYLLDTIHLSDVNWREVKYFIPPLVKGTHATLRIEPERSFVPKGPDKRELGVAVRNFTWECSPLDPIGVYELEREGNDSFYWTGGQASFPLDLSEEAISLRLLSAPSQNQTDVDLYWGGTFLKRAVLAREQWDQISLKIPHGNRNRVLTIRVSQITNPMRMGQGKDVRDLGVRLLWPPAYPSGKPVIIQTKEIGTLKQPLLYGISNNGNWPIQLLSYPIQSVPPNLQVLKNGVFLESRPHLFDSVSARGEDWVRIFPKSGPAEEFFVSNTVTGDLRVPEGPIVIRMTASGIFAAGQVPVVRLLIDQREIARQPILFQEWTDYYVSVLLPPGGRKLSLQFLNDYYDREANMDRNLLIKEIVAAPAKEYQSELKAGWQMLEKSILVAEPLDPHAPFSPQNYCYFVSSNR